MREEIRIRTRDGAARAGLFRPEGGIRASSSTWTVWGCGRRWTAWRSGWPAHGGNLASDASDSPHRRAGEMRGRVYVGVAGVDASFAPEQSARLAEALRSAEADHVIETYAGKAHGWAVPDLPVYGAAGAERHWRRLLDFFGETLV